MKLTYIQQSGSPPIGDGGDQYTGLDRFGRVVDQRWIKDSTGADLERVQYGYTQASNRVWRANTVAEALSANQDEYYTYDGLYQLAILQRGTLNSGKIGISGTPTWEEDLTFDPTGNWNNYVNKVNGTQTLNQPRTHNAVNEILTISGSSALMVQDGAGNMTKTPQVGDWTSANAMIYDAWNRLVKVLDGGTTVAVYAYDGQNRRVSKTTGATTRHYYYSSQWQILEERLNAATTAERQFVWGRMGIDDLVLRDRGSERLYSLQDVFNCTAVVNASGVVKERYGYNAFGLSRVMTPAFKNRASSSYDWETRYACYGLDSESNFYQVRNRYLHPTLGRWITRDPIEYRDGVNLYSYAVNNPANRIDQFGKESKKCKCCTAQWGEYGDMYPQFLSPGTLLIGLTSPYSFTCTTADCSGCTCSLTDVSGTITSTFTLSSPGKLVFNNAEHSTPCPSGGKNGHSPDYPGPEITGLHPTPPMARDWSIAYDKVIRKISCYNEDSDHKKPDKDATTDPLTASYKGTVNWKNYKVTQFTSTKVS